MMNEYTEIYYINKEGEKIKLNDCLYHNSFMFDKQHFVLVSKNNRYFICCEHDIGDKKKKLVLLSFWGLNKNDILPSEAVSIFRKEYKKNNITNELIVKFFDKPLKYTLLKLKTKKGNGKKSKKAQMF